MLVLGIETSCDETGIALYDTKKGLLAHRLHSQIAIHAQYGGVVPELASRDHIRKVIPLVENVLADAGLDKNQLDAIAYTAGPGLVGALLVGACVAKSMAWGLAIPCIPVHHMEGHLLAPMLEDPPPEFPFLALLVSGGHTLLVDVKGIGDYQLLGSSVDDAVGEAFDKTAKLLGLGYPGGPELAKLAQRGDPKRFTFPRPMTDRPGLDFSFSGLKTFARNTLSKAGDDDTTKADIARAFEDAVVDTMIIKCRRALEQMGLKRLVIAGGVGANIALREGLGKLMESIEGEIFYPRIEFCTDNGAMIAFAGAMRFQAGDLGDPSEVVRARWPLDQLNPI